MIQRNQPYTHQSLFWLFSFTTRTTATVNSTILLELCSSFYLCLLSSIILFFYSLTHSLPVYLCMILLSLTRTHTLAHSLTICTLSSYLSFLFFHFLLMMMMMMITIILIIYTYIHLDGYCISPVLFLLDSCIATDKMEHFYFLFLEKPLIHAYRIRTRTHVIQCSPPIQLCKTTLTV